MNQNNLLASVTLFGELYNSETYKGVPDILTEFIKGAIIHEKTYSFNSYQLKGMLKTVFGFDIPESVLRTVVKNRLKDFITIENKIYHCSTKINSDFKGFESEVNSINKIQDTLFSNLLGYVNKRLETTLTLQEEEKLFECFVSFLIDNSNSSQYSDLIMGYLVSNEENTGFQEHLHQIKEGVILYQGINYSTDISHLGNWDEPLSIYLSTEHLFNCVGFNGLLFQEIFNDFYSLVLEINKKSKKGDLIKLYYLDETKKEISEFFQNAEDIKKGWKRLNPQKVAMKAIIDRCQTPKDIKIQLARFYKTLDDKGITIKPFHFDIENSEYNVVDQSLINELKSFSEEKNMPFNEDYCLDTLRIFTRINTYRKGNNKLPFDKIRHIYITENGFAKYLAHNSKVKFGEYDVAFAKDIDFICSKFWFKLKKGFGKNQHLPKSFDLINKAKIIISSHLNSTLTSNFERLQSDFKEGKISEEEAILLNESLKEAPSSPDEITFENIDKSLDILFNEELQEDILREQSRKDDLLKDTLKEKEQLEEELNKIKEKEQLKAQKDLEQKLVNQLNIETKKRVSDIITSSKKAKNYCLKVLSLTFLPILIAIMLKAIPAFDNYLQSLGAIQYLVYGILGTISLVELFGRSYIFDKPKVKRGWNFLLIQIAGKTSEYEEELFEPTKEQIKAANTVYEPIGRSVG